MYPRNLQEFYRELYTKGVRLSHQFQLTVSNTGIGEVDNALQDISMWAQGASTPSRTQNEATISYLGYPFKVPTNFVMSNSLDLTVNADSDLKIRDALLTWMATISDPDIEGGTAGGGIKSISTAVGRLDLFDDKMETIVHSYRLVGMFPTLVGEIALSNTPDVTIATFPAKFSYQYWVTDKSPNF